MSFREMFMGVPKEERQENRQWEAEIKSLETEYKRIEALARGRENDRQLQNQLFSAKEKWGQKVSAFEAYKRGRGL